MENKLFFSTSELAKLSGISRVAIFKKIRNGQIRAKKQGRNYAVPVGEARKIIAAKIAPKNEAIIKKAVNLAVKEYGETFMLLGQE